MPDTLYRRAARISIPKGIYPPWRENDPQVDLWAYYPAGGILLVKEIINGRERHYTYTGQSVVSWADEEEPGHVPSG